MEAIKENGAGKVGAVEDDMGDGMQCSDHPFRNNLSGICAFCLQEKLGKLVSSSFPLPIRGSTSTSSSPPFRSEKVGTSGTTINGVPTSSSSLSLAVRATCARTREEDFYYIKKTRIPFLLAKKKKIMASSQSDRDIVFKRSKSTTNPRRGSNFMDSDNDGNYFTPRKNGRFWSFLYKQHNNGKKTEKIESITAGGSTVKASQRGFGGSSNIVVVEEDEEFSPSNSQATASAASSFDRKVSRSRSVGCGSRSFSGDFFERISTGFGDCTLRRVESQREGKPGNQQGGVMKERVKCGGIFSGFIMTSSSSSSSSSSHWVSSSSTVTTSGSHLHNGKNNWSWSWAFASPMRAFSSKQLYSSKDGNKRDHQARNKNSKPDLNAIPSLLAVRV